MQIQIRGQQLELPPYVYQKVRPGMPKGVYMWHIENGEYADLGEELFVALCEIGWRREVERLTVEANKQAREHATKPIPRGRSVVECDFLSETGARSAYRHAEAFAEIHRSIIEQGRKAK